MIAHDDVARLAASVAQAFDRYRAFAPAGWESPTADAEEQTLRRWLAEQEFWGEMAADEDVIVGHCAFIGAARHSFRPENDASLAHLGHLFVAPAYWGSGAAVQLLAHARSAAASRGYTAMRLFVPVGQARARRFYEREGFLEAGEPFTFSLGLPSLEYRQQLED